jgi:hypothetical protein
MNMTEALLLQKWGSLVSMSTRIMSFWVISPRFLSNRCIIRQPIDLQSDIVPVEHVATRTRANTRFDTADRSTRMVSLSPSASPPRASPRCSTAPSFDRELEKVISSSLCPLLLNVSSPMSRSADSPAAVQYCW